MLALALRHAVLDAPACCVLVSAPQPANMIDVRERQANKTKISDKFLLDTISIIFCLVFADLLEKLDMQDKQRAEGGEQSRQHRAESRDRVGLSRAKCREHSCAERSREQSREHTAESRAESTTEQRA